NSLNHYALGSIGEWLYTGVAGLDQAPDSVGYRDLLIRPFPGDLEWAAADYESPRGTISVRWEGVGDDFRLWTRIPPGASATVHLPGGQIRRVSSGDHTFGGDPA
ncbi:MAG: alpha-L-rhamnosidase, partial [Nonomuraea sp.]|nr:alpha-L-rhamnosidase [Nonomuraea sp.]